MTKEKDEFWADVQATAKAAIEEKPVEKKKKAERVPEETVVGCTCAPAMSGPLCGWCSLTEAERERLRSTQTK